MSNAIITQNKLKETLNYTPETGIFKRIKAIARCSKVGDLVGSYSLGYLTTSINNKRYKLHRLAWLYMTGEWPVNSIDHINHIKTDNRFLNLREVTRAENSRNIKLNKRNKSGVTGVCWHKNKKKWISQISVNKSMIHLGYYQDITDAIIARKMAEYEHGFHYNHGKS